MKRQWLVWVGAVIALSSCGESGARSCEEDVDCPLGEHCALGICDLECREDVDCLDLPGAACDERGRCRGCLSDADCDDGVFCNGVEECAGASAGAIGTCNPGTPPCVGACDEVTRTCDDTSCPDLDMDGFADIRCGGDDCDDDDPDAYPGNTEVCDSEGHDEDCDPDTFGADDDEDGYQSDECCNGDRCGTDCDDDLAGRNPGAVDGCGGGDEDCDGSLDEEPDSIFYRDQDSDNYGVTTDTIAACSLPSGYAAASGDCSDDPFAVLNANEINPGATEICDAIDNDCSGSVDDVATGSCSCTTPGGERACGLANPAQDGVGVCRSGVQTCSDGEWTTCVGFVAPMDEACDAGDLDEDCDGDSDESGALGTTLWYTDADDDGYGDDGLTQAACERPTGGTYADRGGDCDDTRSGVYPSAPEICDHLSQDCDGRFDEGEDFECLEDFDESSGGLTDAFWVGGVFDNDHRLISTEPGEDSSTRTIAVFDAPAQTTIDARLLLYGDDMGSGFSGSLTVELDGHLSVVLDMESWTFSVRSEHSFPPTVLGSTTIPTGCRFSGNQYPRVGVFLNHRGWQGTVETRFSLSSTSCPSDVVVTAPYPESQWMSEAYLTNGRFPIAVRLGSGATEVHARVNDVRLFRAGRDDHRGSCVACISALE